jgi:hypothetical protein
LEAKEKNPGVNPRSIRLKTKKPKSNLIDFEALLIDEPDCSFFRMLSFFQWWGAGNIGPNSKHHLDRINMTLGLLVLLQEASPEFGHQTSLS